VRDHDEDGSSCATLSVNEDETADRIDFSVRSRPMLRLVPMKQPALRSRKDELSLRSSSSISALAKSSTLRQRGLPLSNGRRRTPHTVRRGTAIPYSRSRRQVRQGLRPGCQSRRDSGHQDCGAHARPERHLRALLGSVRPSPDATVVIGSTRRECLDHIVVLSERHLLAVLTEYVRYFNYARPHQALAQCVRVRTSIPHCDGRVVALSVLGGLRHEYRGVA
jgi:hypothetical protein